MALGPGDIAVLTGAERWATLLIFGVWEGGT